MRCQQIGGIINPKESSNNDSTKRATNGTHQPDPGPKHRSLKQNGEQESHVRRETPPRKNSRRAPREEGQPPHMGSRQKKDTDHGEQEMGE